MKICVSIFPQTVGEALNLIQRTEKNKADFVEVRLDQLKSWDKLSDIVDSSKIPMIATNRSSKNQGRFTGNEKKRKKTLISAAESGFQYVDIELSISDLKDTCDILHGFGARVILSFHDFEKTLSIQEMNRILNQELSSGADICKIVTTTRSIEDNLTVLDFVFRSHKIAKIVCFAMGELGKASRLLSPIFGAYFTLASIGRGQETAPGQISVQEMRNIYKNLRLM